MDKTVTYKREESFVVFIAVSFATASWAKIVHFFFNYYYSFIAYCLLLLLLSCCFCMIVYLSDSLICFIILLYYFGLFISVHYFHIIFEYYGHYLLSYIIQISSSNPKMVSQLPTRGSPSPFWQLPWMPWTGTFSFVYILHYFMKGYTR